MSVNEGRYALSRAVFACVSENAIGDVGGNDEEGGIRRRILVLYVDL
jgi:hypothetical protein